MRIWVPDVAVVTGCLDVDDVVEVCGCSVGDVIDVADGVSFRGGTGGACNVSRRCVSRREDDDEEEHHRWFGWLFMCRNGQ